MPSAVDCYVIGRESNVVRVDFGHEPDPPAPSFPGGNGLHSSGSDRDESEAPAPVGVRALERHRRSSFHSGLRIRGPARAGP